MNEKFFFTHLFLLTLNIVPTHVFPLFLLLMLILLYESILRGFCRFSNLFTIVYSTFVGCLCICDTFSNLESNSRYICKFHIFEVLNSIWKSISQVAYIFHRLFLLFYLGLGTYFPRCLLVAEQVGHFKISP